VLEEKQEEKQEQILVDVPEMPFNWGEDF